MKKQFFFVLVLLFSLSCTDDLSDGLKNDQQVEQNAEDLYAIDSTFVLKKKFARAFAKALEESKEVRELVKNEALKKINYDYDVLYLLVKDKKLSNGMTLENIMLKYTDENTLASIEQKMPTLTIFVPTLPENSFSAETWNVTCEIPKVAIRTCATNDVPEIDSKGNELTIPAGKIPIYPIVVIKENERIVPFTGTRSSDPLNSQSTVLPTNNSNIQLQFINDSFNNTGSKSIKTRASGNNSTSEIPADMQKVFDAYDKYQNIDGWQRDYIYYDISPTNDRGSLKSEYKEYLCSFKMLGPDALNSIKKISKPTDSDPKLNDRAQLPAWTDGIFEFEMKIDIGTKHPTGNELFVYFAAEPKDLFATRRIRMNPDRGYVEVRVDSCITHYLSVPLFTWDLEYNSPIIKISMSEIDNPTTASTTTETTNEFATNFEFSTKIGMKFGASHKETRKTSYTHTTTYGNDDLGQLYVNFGDPILLGNKMIPSAWRCEGRRTCDRIIVTGYQPPYNPSYQTYWYKINISPKKMY